jgi:hypothetical protein
MIDVKPSAAYRYTFFQTFSTEPQVVSTSVQPRVEPHEIFDGDAEGGEDDDILGGERVPRLAGVRQEADALRPQLVVHVRVDDLAGQEDAPRRELEPRLVGVVHRPVHAVTEAELAGQVDGEAAGVVAVVPGLDVGDQVAVVTGGELAGDLALEVEALLEDE